MVAARDPQHTTLEELAFLFGIASDSASVEQETEVVRAYATVRQALTLHPGRTAQLVTAEQVEAARNALLATDLVSDECDWRDVVIAVDAVLTTLGIEVTR